MITCQISRNLLLIQRTSSTEAKTVNPNKLRNMTLCLGLAESQTPKSTSTTITSTRWPQARFRFNQNFWRLPSHLGQVALTKWLRLRIWSVLWTPKYICAPKPRCRSEWPSSNTTLVILTEEQPFPRNHLPKILKSPSKTPSSSFLKMTTQSYSSNQKLTIVNWIHL